MKEGEEKWIIFREFCEMEKPEVCRRYELLGGDGHALSILILGLIVS